MKDDDYWRKGTHAALSDLAARFDGHPDLSRFSRYCALKDKGLRKPALREIDVLIGELNAIPDLSEKYQIADTLMRAADSSADADNIIPHPLLDKFILPVCKQKSVEHPEDVEALLWINTEEALREVLRRSPNHALASSRLIRRAQSQIGYATHHLPTGVPPARHVVEWVEECESLFGSWVNKDRAWLFFNYRLDRMLADSLTRYEESGTDKSFEEWARLLNLPACYDDAISALARQGVTEPEFPD
jgi:hypothetical protein